MSGGGGGEEGVIVPEWGKPVKTCLMVDIVVSGKRYRTWHLSGGRGVIVTHGSLVSHLLQILR